MSNPQSSMPFSQRELDARQEADIRSSLVTPDYIYVELQLLKDYTIGALLTKLSKLPEDEAEVLFAEIKKNQTDYDHRITDDIAQYFPSFKMSADDIEAMIRNPEYTEDILNYAPGTQFIVAMKSNLNTNINHSAIDQKFKKVPVKGSTSRYYKQWDEVTYIVNTWPLPKPKGIQLKKLQLFFARTFASNVVVTSKDPKELPEEFYARIDEFNIYQIGRHNENKQFSAASVNMRITQKLVFSSMIFERQKLKPYMFTEKGFRMETEIVHAQGNLIYRQFDWISPGFMTISLDHYGDLASMFDDESFEAIKKEILEYGIRSDT